MFNTQLYFEHFRNDNHSHQPLLRKGLIAIPYDKFILTLQANYAQKQHVFIINNSGLSTIINDLMRFDRI